MLTVSPYYVILDANIWISEHLLQSSVGSAFLYAVTGTKSAILLPEVVELEVSRVLPDMAERAVAVMRRELTLLRQLSGQNLTLTGPSSMAIEEGIKERWKQLSGSLIRVPFTELQARSALERVIRKAPPCGNNNEQFRDCCIWEAVMSMAGRVVHLVSADSAFYENRSRAELASALRAELTTARKDVRIHSSLSSFLEAAGSGAARIDETSIGDAIIKAIMDQAREIAAEGTGEPPGATFKLSMAHRPKIVGHATPKPSLVAISFEASFDLERTHIDEDAEIHDEAMMMLKGVCSFDPTTKDLSEVEIREWRKELKSASGSTSWGTLSPDKTALERQYGPGRMRFIS
jgi:hypothetical protein